MSLDLARLIKPEIDALIASGNAHELRASLIEFHAADIDSVIRGLDAEHQIFLFEALDHSQQYEVFSYLQRDVQLTLIDGLKPDTRKRVLEHMSPDDRARFITELPDEQAQRLLADLSHDERKVTMALLASEKKTAGRIMTPEFLNIRATDTVESAFRMIREEAEHVETVYVAYVLDEAGKLAGTVSLRDMLRARADNLVSDIMTTEPVSCRISTNQEELARTMKKYDLLAIPVLTDDHRLAGIVTFDDIHDVVDAEASEDILRMHGIATHTDSYFEASFFTRLRQRIQVLIALVLVSTLSVLLQQEYNHIISHVSILAVYLSMIMGSSGNCGTQIAGIMIRAQAVQHDKGWLSGMLLREIGVGLAMAGIMATAAIVLVFVRGADAAALNGHSVAWVATIVGLAMFTALGTINLLGGLIPLIMNKLKLDPAITAGPFITTAADILTVLIYFNIAAWMLS